MPNKKSKLDRMKTKANNLYRNIIEDLAQSRILRERIDKGLDDYVKALKKIDKELSKK